jgi:hypothetical protein
MNMRGLVPAAPAVLALIVWTGAFAQDPAPKVAPQSVAKTPPSAPSSAPRESGSDQAAPPGTMIDEPAAVLQALDKVTARVRRITVKVGEDVKFGTLSIKLDACRRAPPEDTPESAAFLEITDGNAGGAPHLAFSGWMFASSPALSAMDHPVYDISVVECASAATAAAASSPPVQPSSSGR